MSDSLNVLKFDLDSHNLIGTLGILFHCVYINHGVPYKIGYKKTHTHKKRVDKRKQTQWKKIKFN